MLPHGETAVFSRNAKGETVARSSDGHTVYPRGFRPVPMIPYEVVLTARLTTMGDLYYLADLASAPREDAPTDCGTLLKIAQQENKDLSRQRDELNRQLESFRQDARSRAGEAKKQADKVRSLTNERDALDGANRDQSDRIQTLEAERESLLEQLRVANARTNELLAESNRGASTVEHDTFVRQIEARDKTIRSCEATIVEQQALISTLKARVGASETPSQS